MTANPEFAVMLNLEDLTCSKIDYIGIFCDPEIDRKILIILVGERGFEPPTPWSRNTLGSNPNASNGVA
jgi:hypothetical protein